MIVKINRTEEIRNRAKKEGKLFSLNSPEHMAAIVKMNKEMEELRREFIFKNWQSQLSAAQTIVF
jgi:hypothetical protein